jgi:hypothetical protein
VEGAARGAGVGQADAAAGLAVDDPEVLDELEDDELEEDELEEDEPSDPDDVVAADAAVTGALRVPVLLLLLPFDAARASVR